MRRDRPGGLRLREAVRGHCADQKDKLTDYARELLARLADSANAAEAFDRLKLNELNEAIPILHSCVTAELVARTFAERVTAEKRALERTEVHDKAVVQLRNFVSEEAKRNLSWRGVIEEDGLMMVYCEPNDFQAMEFWSRTNRESD